MYFKLKTIKKNPKGKYRWSDPKLISSSILQTKDFTANRIVDIYSFGTLLWFLWHKKQPFYDKNDIEIQNILLNNPNNPMEIDYSCPPRFRNLIQSCWKQEISIVEIIIKLKNADLFSMEIFNGKFILIFIFNCFILIIFNSI